MVRVAKLQEIRLARRMRDGELSAFDEFAGSIGSRLFRYSLMVCRHRDDAEEVVQETLLEVYLRIRELRQPEEVHSWFFRIARNACLMKRRRSIFAPSCELSLEGLMRTCVSEAPLEVADPAAMPEAELLGSETRRAVGDAIGLLPENHRMVVVLRYFEGLSTEETAQALGLSTDVVKARLHRARQSMRRSLAAPVCQ